MRCLSQLCCSFSAQTEKGSALHEAALFGKADVVQKLLSAGQDFSPCFNHLLQLPKNPCLTLRCFLSSARYRCEHRRSKGPGGAGHCQGHALPEEQRDSCSHPRWGLRMRTEDLRWEVISLISHQPAVIQSPVYLLQVTWLENPLTLTFPLHQSLRHRRVPAHGKRVKFVRC